jgi:hypothetical protein
VKLRRVFAILGFFIIPDEFANCPFFFFHFLLDIFFIYISNFKCYPESPLYPPPALLPYLPTPASWPWHSPVLGHIKFAIPRGFFSQ